MGLFYSVPEPIVKEKVPNPSLVQYMEEARMMGASRVKFNIGSLSQADDRAMEKLIQILKRYPIKVSIENDQTLENGRLQAVKEALKRSRQAEKRFVGYTMDLGNWHWQKQNPMDAFHQVKDHITVLHLKNILYKRGEPQTVLLEEGEITWKTVLFEIEKEVPVILEYPMDKNEISGQIDAVQSVLSNR